MALEADAKSRAAEARRYSISIYSHLIGLPAVTI